MSREEVIRFLSQLQQILIDSNSWKNVKQAINESFDMAIEALEAQEWISVKKQLPENPTQNYNMMTYLVCFKNGTMAILSWCDGWNCCFNEDDTIYRESEIKDVVAWMPLPKPFKEGKK